MSDVRSRKYTRRQFVLYQHVMEGGATDRGDDAVAAYVREHPSADLDELMTFADWLRDGNGVRPAGSGRRGRTGSAG